MPPPQHCPPQCTLTGFSVNSRKVKAFFRSVGFWSVEEMLRPHLGWAGNSVVAVSATNLGGGLSSFMRPNETPDFAAQTCSSCALLGLSSISILSVTQAKNLEFALDSSFSHTHIQCERKCRKRCSFSQKTLSSFPDFFQISASKLPWRGCPWPPT